MNDEGHGEHGGAGLRAEGARERGLVCHLSSVAPSFSA
jgi:hypothetical protein